MNPICAPIFSNDRIMRNVLANAEDVPICYSLILVSRLFRAVLQPLLLECAVFRIRKYYHCAHSPKRAITFIMVKQLQRVDFTGMDSLDEMIEAAEKIPSVKEIRLDQLKQHFCTTSRFVDLALKYRVPALSFYTPQDHFGWIPKYMLTEQNLVRLLPLAPSLQKLSLGFLDPAVFENLLPFDQLRELSIDGAARLPVQTFVLMCQRFQLLEVFYLKLASAEVVSALENLNMMTSLKFFSIETNFASSITNTRAKELKIGLGNFDLGFWGCSSMKGVRKNNSH